jgi:pyruvate formate lyase activating enzyme
MIIAGIEKTSLLDYPGKVSTIVFTYGCNLRCPYCHNPELVIEPPLDKYPYTKESFFNFLKRRKNKLDGVVITGGEPLINRDIGPFIQRIKDMGFLVKLDTNGSYPKKLKSLLRRNLLDYIDMDVKYKKELYTKGVNGGVKIPNVSESIDIIMNSGIEYSFRTTFVKSIHTVESVEDICKMIKGADTYYIQNFRAGKTIDPSLDSSLSFSRKELKDMKGRASHYVKKVIIRD